MPELDDDLRAMLHDRAENAPATPAPTDALVRRVRRRRAARATLAVATSVAGVAAVAVGAVALQPTSKAASPVTSQPTTTLDTSPGSKYEFCTGQTYLQVYVAVHPTELKFARGCYKVVEGATGIVFNNPQVGVEHNLVITREGETTPVYRSVVIKAAGPNAGLTGTTPALARGDYYLTCTLHPSMHAQLVVR